MKKIYALMAAFLFWGMAIQGPVSTVSTAHAQEEASESEDEEDDEDDMEGFEDDEDGFGEDDEDGFGDEGGDDPNFPDIQIDTSAIKVEAPKTYSLGGFIKQELSYANQKPDSDLPFNRKKVEFNKIKSTLNLEFNWEMFQDWRLKVSGNGFYDAYYSQHRPEDFPDETLEAYESEAELRDTFVEGRLFGGLWLKVGRQIIAWGESEGGQIVDMANPRDNRELGMVDIEDARIPVFATKLSYLNDGWELNLVGIHEFRPNKVGTQGADFDPYIGLRAGQTKIDDAEDPEGSDANTEVLARVFKSFNGGDVGIMAADVLDDSSYLDFDTKFGGFVPRYKRIKVVGAYGNIVSGSWLFKFEAASRQDAALGRTGEDLSMQFSQRVQEPKSWSEKNLSQLMVGTDYSGITDLSATFEVSVTKIEDYEDNLRDDEVQTSPSINLRYDAWNNTLHPSLLWAQLANQNGDILRVSTDYDYTDGVVVSGGFAVYDAAENDDVLYAFRQNDRIFASLKYSF